MEGKCYLCNRTAKEVLDFVYSAEGQGTEEERIRRSEEEIAAMDREISQRKDELDSKRKELEQLGMYSDIVKKTGQITVDGITWYDIPEDLFTKYGSWNIEKFDASKICDYPFAAGEREKLEALFPKMRPGDRLADHKSHFMEESARLVSEAECLTDEAEAKTEELSRLQNKRAGYRKFAPYSAVFGEYRVEPAGLPPVNVRICPLCSGLVAKIGSSILDSGAVFSQRGAHQRSLEEVGKILQRPYAVSD